MAQKSLKRRGHSSGEIGKSSGCTMVFSQITSSPQVPSRVLRQRTQSLPHAIAIVLSLLGPRLIVHVHRHAALPRRPVGLSPKPATPPPARPVDRRRHCRALPVRPCKSDSDSNRKARPMLPHLPHRTPRLSRCRPTPRSAPDPPDRRRSTAHRPHARAPPATPDCRGRRRAVRHHQIEASDIGWEGRPTAPPPRRTGRKPQRIPVAPKNGSPYSGYPAAEPPSHRP